MSRHHQRLLTLLLFSTLVHGALVWLSLDGVANKYGVENARPLSVVLVQVKKARPKPTTVMQTTKPIPAVKSTHKTKHTPVQPLVRPTAKAAPIIEQAAELSISALETPVLDKPDSILPAPVFKAAQPKTSNPKPHYPLVARRRGLQGEVVLILEIDERGQVVHASIQRSSGYPVLDRAAEQTVSRWRFTPALSDGKAVTASVEVPIMFALNYR